MIHSNQTTSVDDLTMFAGHLLIIFYCLIFILGFFGNSAVIYVAILKKNYRNVTNCYIINLALADLLFLTLSIPYTTYLGLVDTYPFGMAVCKIYTYLAYVFLLATCNTLAAMSIDRYSHIVVPRSKLRWRTPQNAFIICVIIWIVSLILIIPYHITSHMFTSSSSTCSVNDHKNFLVCFLVFCSYYAIPLFIIIICYTKIAIYVRQSGRLISGQINTKHTRKSLAMKHRRVTRMVIIVTLAFAICWLPIHILELMKCADSSVLYTLNRLYPKFLYAVRVFTHALAYFNSCLNPYLYALLNRNFCFHFMDVIPSCLSCCRNFHLTRTQNKDVNTNLVSSVTIPEFNHIQRGENSTEEDEDDEHENNVVHRNVCGIGDHVELLQLK